MTLRPTSTGRSRAGRKGGLATRMRHGRDFYSMIGRKGGEARRWRSRSHKPR